jgi:hypothetical protein
MPTPKRNAVLAEVHLIFWMRFLMNRRGHFLVRRSMT